MKLHEVSNRTWVRILPSDDFKIAPASKDILANRNDVIFFDHIDGMYSFCKDQSGDVVHPVAWAEVEVITDQEFLRERVSWGGRGKDGDQEVTVYKIMELSDNHLKALVTYIKDVNVSPQMAGVINGEVEYRKNNNIKVKDYA